MSFDLIHRQPGRASISRPLLILGLVSAALSGCIISFGDVDARSASIPYSVISSGKQSGISNQQLHVLQDTTQYAALLSTISISGSIPNTDFSDSTLIAVFSGLSGTGCDDSLSVSEVKERSETVLLKLTKHVPGADAACPDVMPQDGPYLFIEIEKNTKPISVLFDVATY